MGEDGKRFLFVLCCQSKSTPFYKGLISRNFLPSITEYGIGSLISVLMFHEQSDTIMYTWVSKHGRDDMLGETVKNVTVESDTLCIGATSIRNLEPHHILVGVSQT